MSECGCEIEIRDKSQKRIGCAAGYQCHHVHFRIGIGLVHGITSLIADSMDMLADAIVYGIGLYAIGKAAEHKAHAALLSGWFQGALGLLILVDMARRVIVGSEPVSALMMGSGSLP